MLDRIGCPDWDGDGWSNLNDDFPLDERFWIDTDGDGVDDSEDLWPDDAKRSRAGDSLEPGIMVFAVLSMLAIIVIIFLPKKDSEGF